MNRHHHGLGGVFDRLQHREQGQTRPQPGRHLLKFADVCAGNERGACADHDNGLDGWIIRRRLDGIEDALGNSRTERIHRGIIDGDHADAIFFRELY